MKDFAEQGRAEAARLREGRRSRRTTRPTSSSSATINGKLYGLIFKGANKSTVWYNVHVVQERRRQAAEDLDELLTAREDAQGVRHAAVLDRRRRRLDAHRPVREHLPPRRRAPDKYDQLTDAQDQVDRPVGEDGAHDDGDRSSATRANIAGGTSGALQTDFPTSVTNVFQRPAEGRDGDRGRLRPGRRRTVEPAEADRRATTCSRSRRSTARPPSVVGGGDIDHDVQGHAGRPRRSIKYLATPEAAEIWAKRGGFSSPNKNVDAERLPRRDHADDRDRRSPTAKTFRFDMSDLQPAAFGGTVGQGEFKILQDFLKNPTDVNGTAAAARGRGREGVRARK